MCLSAIFKRDCNASWTGIGYKVFIKGTLKNGRPAKSYTGQIFGTDDQYIKGRVYRSDNMKTVQFNNWGRYNSEITADNGHPYPYGFHIFTNQRSAQSWRGKGRLSIVKVAYKEGHTLGVQENNPDQFLRVIVARQMKILEEIV